VRGALEGRAVLVTGGTGFLGKVLVEKLLRCVPQVRRVLVLVRPAGGAADPSASARERFESEVCASPVFAALARQLGSADAVRALCASKLEAVAGDVTLAGLGLSAAALASLRAARPEVVFHCAASVNFDDPLDEALRLNAAGAVAVVELARSLGSVQAFVHVSTAYVQANMRNTASTALSEELPRLDLDPAELVAEARAQLAAGQAAARKEPGALFGLDRLWMRLRGEWPNTYTLSKAVGELLVARAREELPVAIVRPSIVGAAWTEPEPGWVDVVSAASAVFVATGLGVVTLLPGNPLGVAALVPVDTVVAHMLLACADVFGRRGALHVSHSCTSDWQPVRWRVVSRRVVGAFQRRRPAAKLTPGPVRIRMLSSRDRFNLEWALRYQAVRLLPPPPAAVGRCGAARCWLSARPPAGCVCRSLVLFVGGW
jgi:nucleoside-diphosphate-sugar epimerase